LIDHYPHNVSQISEPAFDQLRTKEQLGYIVHAGTKQVGQNAGLHIIIQSGVKDPHYLNNRIEEFLTAFRVDLAAYSAEKFASFVTAVVEKLAEKPKNIDEESGRYWEEIRTGRYLFDRKKQLVAVLQSAQGLTLQHVLSFYDRYLLDRALRVKFSSQFYGSKTKYHALSGPNSLLIKDLSVFKRSVALHPVQVFEPELRV
jgi:insulysin